MLTLLSTLVLGQSQCLHAADGKDKPLTATDKMKLLIKEYRAKGVLTNQPIDGKEAVEKMRLLMQQNRANEHSKNVSKAPAPASVSLAAQPLQTDVSVSSTTTSHTSVPAASADKPELTKDVFVPNWNNFTHEQRLEKSSEYSEYTKYAPSTESLIRALLLYKDDPKNIYFKDQNGRLWEFKEVEKSPKMTFADIITRPIFYERQSVEKVIHGEVYLYCARFLDNDKKSLMSVILETDQI